jgi:hypothetical protein
LRGLTTFRQAFALALDLHPTDQQPVDMTYGNGGMWKGIHGYRPLRCDGNHLLPDLDHVVLWRDLPQLLGSHTRELLVGDPIFVDHVGKNSTHRRFALTAEGPAADGSVVDLLREIMTVARELVTPRGTFLLKIGEQNHADRPQRHGHEVNTLGDRLGLFVCGQWTMPSRSMTDIRRQTVRHYPSALHLFILHPHKNCPSHGLALVGRTKCAWCHTAIVVERVGTANYCCVAHRMAAFRDRQKRACMNPSASSPDSRPDPRLAGWAPNAADARASGRALPGVVGNDDEWAKLPGFPRDSRPPPDQDSLRAGFTTSPAAAQGMNTESRTSRARLTT